MGAGQSSLSATGDQNGNGGGVIGSSPTSSASAALEQRFGFQILRVHPNSPSSEAVLYPCFDYIIAVNGVEVSMDMPNLIGEMARNHVNKPLRLTLYNARQDEIRDVTLVPRSGWGGEGLLGCSIRMTPLTGIRDRVWHVLAVLPGSPAAAAGLRPLEDYIVGSPDLVIRNEEDFFHLLTQNTKRPVNLLVFRLNPADSGADVGTLRTVTIVPDFGWGGEGCVGCDVGAGMLHWIPALRREARVDASQPIESASEAKTEPASFKTTPQQSDSIPLFTGALDTPPSSSNQTAVFAVPPVSQASVAAPPVIVSVPQSRPVIANLSSAVPAPVPLAAIQPPAAPIGTSIPPAMSHLLIDDDIPKPNFTVPSEIFAASASTANDRPDQAAESSLS